MRVIIAIALLTSAAFAQPPQQPVAKAPRFQLTWADAVYAAGWFADAKTSIGKYEANPLWRNDRGLFDVKKNALMSGVELGLFKALEWHFRKPSERRWIRLVEASAGGFRFGLGLFHNRKIARIGDRR